MVSTALDVLLYVTEPTRSAPNADGVKPPGAADGSYVPRPVPTCGFWPK